MMREIPLITLIFLLIPLVSAQECMQNFGRPADGCPYGSHDDNSEGFPACECDPGLCYAGIQIGCIDFSGESEVVRYDHLGNCIENCDSETPTTTNDDTPTPTEYDDGGKIDYGDFQIVQDATSCGNNAYKDSNGNCICKSGYQVYDSRIGCEKKWGCPENSHDENGE